MSSCPVCGRTVPPGRGRIYCVGSRCRKIAERRREQARRPDPEEERLLRLRDETLAAIERGEELGINELVLRRLNQILGGGAK